MLTRRQQGLLTVAGMTTWAEALVGGPLDADVAEEIITCVNGPARDRGTALRAFAAGDGQRDLLRDDDIFSLVLERLTDQFILTTLVPDPPGTQRIVKFSYEEYGELARRERPRPAAGRAVLDPAAGGVHGRGAVQRRELPLRGRPAARGRDTGGHAVGR